MIARPIKFVIVGLILGLLSGGIFASVLFLFYFQASKFTWFFGLGSSIGMCVGLCAGLAFAMLARAPQYWGAAGGILSGGAGIWFVSRLTVPIHNLQYIVSLLPATLVFAIIPGAIGYGIARTCSNDYQLDKPKIPLIRWLKN
jgi:hypothetical protein